MADPVLIDRITTKIQDGEKRVKIKEDLLVEGWPEGDIDMAYSHIHREALQQIPLVAWGLRHVHELEAKTANLPPSSWVAILGLSALFLLILAVGMYLVLDPMSSQSSARDNKREAVFKQMNQAIGQYSIDKSAYPASLAQLVPAYLSALPTDPQIKDDFVYTILETGDYRLCVSLETNPVACFTSEEFIAPAVMEEEQIIEEIPQASPSAKPTLFQSVPKATTSGR